MQLIKELLISVTKEAGSYASLHFKKLAEGDIRYKKLEDGRLSPVTVIDLEIDRMIRQRILDAFPSHDIISEEDESLNNEGKYVWIIDPIDGTKQYMQGSVNYCVTISVALGNESILGTVYAPETDEFYFAEKGSGAMLNDKILRTNDKKTGKIFVGRQAQRPEAAMHPLLKGLEPHKLGSAALEVVRVGTGVADAAYYSGIQIWDIAAATLIAKEAGCRIEDFEGNDYILGNPDLIVYRT